MPKASRHLTRHADRQLALGSKNIHTVVGTLQSLIAKKVDLTQVPGLKAVVGDRSLTSNGP